MTTEALILIIGGGILLVDGVASWIKFKGQPAFNQLVRIERTIFAVILILLGVSL